MSIVICRDCESRVSSQAKACPTCGCPVGGERVLWQLLVSAALGSITFLATVDRLGHGGAIVAGATAYFVADFIFFTMNVNERQRAAPTQAGHDGHSV
ncbi:MAG: hypothetical protein AAF805_05355 [Planctomycetota bacterium]